MSGQLRPRPDREPRFVILLTLRVALIQPVICPQAGRSEATEPKLRFVLLMRADHGTINEAEATKLLGGPRQHRAFSRDLDTYRAQLPFAVRVEMASGGKCYKRGEPEA